MNPYDEESIAEARDRMLALAGAILRGEVGVLLGAARMLEFRYGAGLDEWDDDMITFVGIESQEDHLPVGHVRQLWSAEALARVDPEIAMAEAFHRPAAFAACESLIRRFGTD